MEDRELKDREVTVKRDIVELFCKPIIVSTYKMDKFEQKEMNQIRPIKNNWYDLFINHIPEPITKSVGDFKDKLATLFKTNTP